jgi:hypothetical protein
MTLLIFSVAVAIGIPFLCPMLEAVLLTTTPTHTPGLCKKALA